MLQCYTLYKILKIVILLFSSVQNIGLNYNKIQKQNFKDKPYIIYKVYISQIYFTTLEH